MVAMVAMAAMVAMVAVAMVAVANLNMETTSRERAEYFFLNANTDLKIKPKMY